MGPASGIQLGELPVLLGRFGIPAPVLEDPPTDDEGLNPERVEANGFLDDFQAEIGVAGDYAMPFR